MVVAVVELIKLDLVVLVLFHMAVLVNQIQLQVLRLLMLVVVAEVQTLMDLLVVELVVVEIVLTELR
jgi:hypothetical protein